MAKHICAYAISKAFGVTKASAPICEAKAWIGHAPAPAFTALAHSLATGTRNVLPRDGNWAALSLWHSGSVSLHGFGVNGVRSHAGCADQIPDLPETADWGGRAMGARHDESQIMNAAVHVIRGNTESLENTFATQEDRFSDQGHSACVGIVGSKRLRARHRLSRSCDPSGLTAMLSGLRDRLSTKGDQVLTSMPSLAAARMTEEKVRRVEFVMHPDGVAKVVSRDFAKSAPDLFGRTVWNAIALFMKRPPAQNNKTQMIC